jgi:acetyl-CoA carboxylase biotin carboxyl carrier protein
VVDVEIIKRLIELMVENELAEVSLRDGTEEISLKKAQAPQLVQMAYGAPPAPQPGQFGPPTAEAKPPPKVEDPDAGLHPIRSPMVGTLYAAPDPASPPFVKIGDSITPDTVVCIIEAMKVFNEIKAQVSGRIERILVPNETAVEFDQPLFLVRPA